MAEGLNKVLLLGNLGADPELRVTPGGQAVLKLRLATTETYLDRNNTRQERTEWHSVTVWGKRGEALAKFLKKGERLFVSLHASNHDPAEFSDPNRLDITRDPNPHLGFGTGEHFCLGAHVARLSSRALFLELARRIEWMEPAGTPSHIASSW